MHIQFIKVVLHNFMSFGHSELDINDDGFIQVSGRNENPLDMATSNGSGKSSLWESIIWCLTGDTIRGTKQVSNLYGEDGTFVQLEFIMDNKHYCLLRSKDHKVYKTGLQIHIDGKDCSGKGIRDSEKLLLEYLPDVTASLLGSVIILGQGLPQKFTSNSPSGRKEVLEKLSKSDFMIEDLKKRISSRKEILNTNIRNLEDNSLRLETRKQTIHINMENNFKQLSSLDKTALETTLLELSGNLDSFQNKFNENKSVIEDLTQTSNIFTQRLSQINLEIDNAKMEVDKSSNSTLNSLQIQLNTNITNRRHIESEIQKISSVRDVCPTCGQHIPGVIKPNTDGLKQQLEEIEKIISNTNKEINELNDVIRKRKLSIDADYKNLIEQLKTEKQETTVKLQKCQLEQQLYETKIRGFQYEISELKVKIAQIDNTKDLLIKQNETLSEELNNINQDLLYNSNEKEIQHSHLEVITKFDTVVKRDFRGYLLSSIIEYIQQRTIFYSQTIFETDKVQFYLDGNNIHISYMDKEYENLSGGEKQKIDLIVQFSIRDMLTNHLGFTSNILVLDEVFDGLDMIGCQKVIDVISNFNDIKNVFIVTHRKDLSIPSDRELLVVKSSNGISEIR